MEGILTQIEALSKAKGIDPDIVVQAIKDAILVAARKFYKTNEELIAEFRANDGHVDVFAVKTITDVVSNPGREISLAEAKQIDTSAEVGGEMRFPKATDGLGRISAQLAKQVIFQKIREAERDTICSEFTGRLGQLETCTIKRSEGPDLIVDLGRTEGRLPRREQSKLESFSPGDRIRVVIKTIEKAGRGPAVIVSRGSEDLVRRLFEQEVPEIYDGTVEIRTCAREAGERTKIGVLSHDRDVDAVGACVGMKGMRVQSIIRELRGEKIDIIEYSDDAVEMATRALSPAKISRVTVLDTGDRHLEVVVDDMQLSLAIGKKGQNVRLAAKLMGWRIDIKSEEEKRQEVETAMAAMVGAGTPISILIEHGLADKLVDKLVESDVSTVEKLADMTPEQLEEIPSIGPKMVEKIQVAVNSYYSQFEPQEPPQEEVVPDDPIEVGAAEAVPVKKRAARAIMPGLPVEGEDAAEGEDAEEGDGTMEDEDFDNMDLSAQSVTAEAVESESESEGKTVGAAASVAVSSDSTALESARETDSSEDEEMSS